MYDKPASVKIVLPTLPHSERTARSWAARAPGIIRKRLVADGDEFTLDYFTAAIHGCCEGDAVEFYGTAARRWSPQTTTVGQRSWTVARFEVISLRRYSLHLPPVGCVFKSFLALTTLCDLDPKRDRFKVYYNLLRYRFQEDGSGEKYEEADKTGKDKNASTSGRRKSCHWRHGRRRTGVQFAVLACERSTDSEAVRAPSPDCSSRINSGSCRVSSSCNLGSGTSGRNTKSR